jgi:hypothetical protein
MIQKRRVSLLAYLDASSKAPVNLSIRVSALTRGKETQKERKQSEPTSLEAWPCFHWRHNTSCFSTACCELDFSLLQRWPNNRLQYTSRSRSIVWSIAAAFFGLHQNLFAASVRSLALRLTAFFGSTYLCEEAFFQMKILKSRYRSRLTDECSKYYLHLCLSNYEHTFSKLSQRPFHGSGG